MVEPIRPMSIKSYNICTHSKGEGFEQFYVRLRSLATTYEYGKFIDEFIKNRIVVGLVDDSVRKCSCKSRILHYSYVETYPQSQTMSSASVARVDKFYHKSQNSNKTGS